MSGWVLVASEGFPFAAGVGVEEELTEKLEDGFAAGIVGIRGSNDERVWRDSTAEPEIAVFTSVWAALTDFCAIAGLCFAVEGSITGEGC